MRNILLIGLILFSAATFAQTGAGHKISKEQITGAWKAGNTEYIFDANGNVTSMHEGRTCPGTWVVENNTITINPKKLMWSKNEPCGKTVTLHVVSVNGKKLVIKEADDKNELHLVRQKEKPTA